MTGDPQERMGYMRVYVPVRRLGKAEEVAAAILFPAFDKAAFLTGHSLVTDSGKLAG